MCGQVAFSQQEYTIFLNEHLKASVDVKFPVVVLLPDKQVVFMIFLYGFVGFYIVATLFDFFLLCLPTTTLDYFVILA